MSKVQLCSWLMLTSLAMGIFFMASSPPGVPGAPPRTVVDPGTRRCQMSEEDCQEFLFLNQNGMYRICNHF